VNQVAFSQLRRDARLTPLLEVLEKLIADKDIVILRKYYDVVGKESFKLDCP
jgi:hypothetical protein